MYSDKIEKVRHLIEHVTKSIAQLSSFTVSNTKMSTKSLLLEADEILISILKEMEADKVEVECEVEDVKDTQPYIHTYLITYTNKSNDRYTRIFDSIKNSTQVVRDIVEENNKEIVINFFTELTKD